MFYGVMRTISDSTFTYICGGINNEREGITFLWN